jgi:signal transduction histidine kinase
VAPGDARRIAETAAALIAAAAVGIVAEYPLWGSDPALAGVNLAVSLTFVLVGFLLRGEPGQQATAAALVLAGLFRPILYLDAWNSGPLPFFTSVFGATDRVFGAWVLLRYPDPRLSRVGRVFVTALAGWSIGWPGAAALTATPADAGYPDSVWWPTARHAPGLAEALGDVGDVGDGALGLVLVALLAWRIRRTGGFDRLVVTPIMISGVLSVIAAMFSAAGQYVVPYSSGPRTAYLVEGVVDLLMPVSFLGALIGRELLRPRVVERTSAELTGDATLDGVQRALRAALRDPTLTVVAVPVPVPSGPVPSGAVPGGAVPGGPVRGGAVPGGPASGVVDYLRDGTGAPVAVVIAAADLARYRILFDTAVRAGAAALEAARLRARLTQAELERTQALRARLAEAALAERRRLERDLHDGAQQHLLGLAAQLSAAMVTATDPVAIAAFGRARTGLLEVLAELRDLAQGIHPPALTRGGLRPALEQVSERLPISVAITAPTARFPRTVEATAYFVVSEALTNTVKHANAENATVFVRMEGEILRVDVTDDGIGGADPRGRGLTNIADRIAALGGDLAVRSPAGRGTSIAARIPCAQPPPVQLPSVGLPSAQVPSAQVPSVELPSAQVPSAQVPSVEHPSTQGGVRGSPCD